MGEAFLSLPVGLIAGFLACIPPGPVNIAVVREASHGGLRAAVWIALGCGMADGIVCFAVGRGTIVLESLLSYPGVRLGLSLLLLAYGIYAFLHDRRRAPDEAPEGLTPPAALRRTHLDRYATPQHPILLGFLQAAANPSLLATWTFLTAFLVGHRILGTGALVSAGFALGIGAGGILWLLVLARLVAGLRHHAVGRWLRRSPFVLALIMVFFGLLFTLKSIREML